ncbi:inositol monophosphatase family protein [Sphingopyxis sp. KK2]|uniref:inositol monophosphatase family protein n=1 Tax=Sphingopyxis sp. KK2 TaxID=1855727 RepID=UPI0027412C48|nr:inositol monophosphatase family protein [Sphingopyxis sp. KK2]
MLPREQVEALMRSVAAEVMMPRFRRLAPGDIDEKSKGEVVTIVDRECERRLHDGLAKLGLGARIIGEEAAELDPDLLAEAGLGLVWLIDPLDGTANFAAGRAPFGMMVALVEDGEPLASWMLDPLAGRMCYAERGQGATVDGRPARARSTRRKQPRAALGTHFLSAIRRDRVHGAARRAFDVQPVPRCAAESYPRLVLGQDDIALFQRILPWDHAAGALFLTETGGKATHWDGRPYRVGGTGQGMLAATTPDLWQTAADILLGAEAGLVEMEEAI